MAVRNVGGNAPTNPSSFRRRHRAQRRSHRSCLQSSLPPSVSLLDRAASTEINSMFSVLTDGYANDYQSLYGEGTASCDRSCYASMLQPGDGYFYDSVHTGAQCSTLQRVHALFLDTNQTACPPGIYRRVVSHDPCCQHRRDKSCASIRSMEHWRHILLAFPRRCLNRSRAEVPHISRRHKLHSLDLLLESQWLGLGRWLRSQWEMRVGAGVLTPSRNMQGRIRVCDISSVGRSFVVF